MADVSLFQILMLAKKHNEIDQINTTYWNPWKWVKDCYEITYQIH